MHTINAVENRRMSKHSSANLFRFYELLLVTDKLRRKLPLRRGWVICRAALSHLARKRGFGLVSTANKGNRVLLVSKQRAIFFQFVIFLQKNSLLRIQNLIGDGGSR